MPKYIITLLFLGAILLLASVAGAEPQPRFVSGTMETGATVTIFGEGFGAVPQDRIPSRPNPSSQADIFGVFAGDGPDWESCEKFHGMPLESWGTRQIIFEFQEGDIQELTPFYLFVVDAEDQASAGIGPWLVGEGILSSSENRIPLRMDQGKLLPDFERPGAPDSSELRPGRPGTPSIRY